MAPKKKKYQPKVGGTSPVVVIFLVFFMLLSIGLGAACYYGYNGQAEFEKKADKAAKDKTAALRSLEWAEFQVRELKDAFGYPLFKDESFDEPNFLNVGRTDEIDWEKSKFKDGSKFKDEKLKPLFEKALEENRKYLGIDAANKRYLTTYPKKIQDLQAELDKAKAEVGSLKDTITKSDKKSTDLHTAFEDEMKNIMSEIKKGNKTAFDEVLKKIKQMDKVLEDNNILRQQIDANNIAAANKLRDKDKLIVELYAELEKVKDKVLVSKPKAGGEPANQGAGGKVHALLLDISKGHPLWDEPKGKVLHVDPAKKQVVINIGKGEGVSKEMTFNIFGPGWSNEAIGPLKGTIEIIDVLDEGTSLARITSRFDDTGKEIALHDPYKGAAQRLANNPIKQGDLLFNLFWKTRVALAGKFNLSGETSPTSAEDHRQIKLYKEFLKKQNIAVDAYIDLTTGKIEGGIYPETRFLIIGDTTIRDDGKEKTAEAELAKVINDNVEVMKKAAIDKGLFMISGYNFAFVTGYRPPHSADAVVVSTFQAGVPTGGAVGDKKPVEAPKDPMPMPMPGGGQPMPMPGGGQPMPMPMPGGGQPMPMPGGGFAEFAGKWVKDKDITLTIDAQGKGVGNFVFDAGGGMAQVVLTTVNLQKNGGQVLLEIMIGMQNTRWSLTVNADKSGMVMEMVEGPSKGLKISLNKGG